MNAAEDDCQCQLAVVVLTEFRGYTLDPSAEGPGNACHGPPSAVRPDSSRGSPYVICLVTERATTLGVKPSFSEWSKWSMGATLGMQPEETHWC